MEEQGEVQLPAEVIPPPAPSGEAGPAPEEKRERRPTKRRRGNNGRDVEGKGGKGRGKGKGFGGKGFGGGAAPGAFLAAATAAGLMADGGKTAPQGTLPLLPLPLAPNNTMPMLPNMPFPMNTTPGPFNPALLTAAATLVLGGNAPNMNLPMPPIAAPSAPSPSPGNTSFQGAVPLLPPLNGAPPSEGNGLDMGMLANLATSIMAKEKNLDNLEGIMNQAQQDQKCKNLEMLKQVEMLHQPTPGGAPGAPLVGVPDEQKELLKLFQAKEEHHKNPYSSLEGNSVRHFQELQTLFDNVPTTVIGQSHQSMQPHFHHGPSFGRTPQAPHFGPSPTNFNAAQYAGKGVGGKNGKKGRF